jgi:hypothetical protein
MGPTKRERARGIGFIVLGVEHALIRCLAGSKSLFGLVGELGIAMIG